MDINNANDNDTIDLKKLFSLMLEKKTIVIAIVVICTIIAIKLNDRGKYFKLFQSLNKCHI